MQSGKIRDNQFTASSHAKHFEAFKARLHGQSCWRSVQNDTGEFLEINFSSQKTYVNGISTQGDPQADNWTQQYYVAYYWGSVWKNLTQAYIEDVKVCNEFLKELCYDILSLQIDESLKITVY